ncbi:MAG: hypothetical protein NZ694_05900 [Tepidimonas sp.]|nr:hypothetical protein [Tepidimonas sp.]
MTSPDFSAWQQAWAPYTRFIPGWAYLQGLATGAPASGDAGAPWAPWVAPVLDVEELQRRIRDLKAVHFWLEQNARALQATIQALEVQRMTLAALRSLNVSLQPTGGTSDAGATPAGANADNTAAAESDAAAAVDPVRWWRAVTEQFQAIAAQTMQDLARPAPEPASPPAAAAPQPAQAPGSGATAAGKPVRRRRP